MKETKKLKEQILMLWLGIGLLILVIVGCTYVISLQEDTIRQQEDHIQELNDAFQEHIHNDVRNQKKRNAEIDKLLKQLKHDTRTN